MKRSNLNFIGSDGQHEWPNYIYTGMRIMRD